MKASFLPSAFFQNEFFVRRLVFIGHETEANPPKPRRPTGAEMDITPEYQDMTKDVGSL